MKAILTLHAEGRLTRQQLIAAERFRRRPDLWARALPPSWCRVLLDATAGRGLSQIERERGWPARSAKCVLAVLLDGLVELGNRGIGDPEDVAETVDPTAIGEAMRAYALTRQQAAILVALRHAAPRAVSVGTLADACGRAGQPTTVGTVTAAVCRLRRKLAQAHAPVAIRSLRDEGYALEPADPFDAREIALYATHVERGLSLRQTADRFGMPHASTVLRIVRRIEAARDTPDGDRRIAAAVASWLAANPELPTEDEAR